MDGRDRRRGRLLTWSCRKHFDARESRPRCLVGTVAGYHNRHCSVTPIYAAGTVSHAGACKGVESGEESAKSVHRSDDGPSQRWGA